MQKPPLLAEAKACDYFAIAVDVAAVEIPQLAPPLAYKLQEASAGVVVVLVRPEVGGQVFNPFGQDCHLDFRGTGIARMRGEVLDQFVFALFGQQPSSCFFLCLSCERDHRITAL